MDSSCGTQREGTDLGEELTNLDGWCTEIGRGVAHGYWMNGGVWSARLNRLFGASCGEFFDRGVVDGCCRLNARGLVVVRGFSDARLVWWTSLIVVCWG